MNDVDPHFSLVILFASFSTLSCHVDYSQLLKHATSKRQHLTPARCCWCDVLWGFWCHPFESQHKSNVGEHFNSGKEIPDDWWTAVTTAICSNSRRFLNESEKLETYGKTLKHLCDTAAGFAVRRISSTLSQTAWIWFILTFTFKLWTVCMWTSILRTFNCPNNPTKGFIFKPKSRARWNMLESTLQHWSAFTHTHTRTHTRTQYSENRVTGFLRTSKCIDMTTSDNGFFFFFDYLMYYDNIWTRSSPTGCSRSWTFRSN